MNIVKKGSLVCIKHKHKHFTRILYEKKSQIDFVDLGILNYIKTGEIVLLLENGPKSDWSKRSPIQQIATKVLYESQIGYVVLYDIDEIII